MQVRGMSNEFTTMELFSGAGGGILASRILGHKPLVAIEWDAYCCQVIRERIADGWFPNMQVHEGDIRLFDPSLWRGRISCINAGFPCQDISNAGGQAGIGEGTRSNLYREVIRIADAVRPEYIFLENVSAIVSKSKNYLEVICKDIAEIGYDAVWTTLPASAIGAKHKRDRWWLLAFPSKQRCDSGGSDREERHVQDNEKRQYSQIRQEGNRPQLGSSSTCDVFSNANSTQLKRKRQPVRVQQKYTNAGDTCRRQTKSSLGRVADDVAHRMDVHDWVQEEAQVGRTTTEKENRANRLKALGNGQVPLQAATAFSILWKIMKESA